MGCMRIRTHAQTHNFQRKDTSAVKIQNMLYKCTAFWLLETFWLMVYHYKMTNVLDYCLII